MYGEQTQQMQHCLSLSSCVQVGMLMLVDWMDPKYTKDGIAFAKHCRESLASMHTDDGICAAHLSA